MAEHRESFLLIFVLYCVIAISGCSGVEPAGLSVGVTTPSQQELVATSTTHAPPGEYRIRAADGMNMVFVPGGTFQMGSTEAEIEDAIRLCQQHYHICNRWYYEREAPQHAISLDDYWLDQTEVSNAQYRLCVEAGICPEPMTCKKGQPTFEDPNKVDHPVVCVDWKEAQTYCQWVGGRLPTEAEWEYAFLGEAGSIFPWGNEFDGSRLNYCDQNCSQPHADERFNDGYPQTAPAGSYLQGVSWSDIFDMGGNVSEWVGDWWGEYSFEEVSNPIGPRSGSEKMIKGCSWFSHPTYCRGAARPSVAAETRFDYLGFRCAVPVKPDTTGESRLTAESIAVPEGEPPTIDGFIVAEEWVDARVETFSEGSELLLLQADGFLFLGIRANQKEMIAGNVFIKQGDQIAILHTSAALGTAVYQQNEDSWRKILDFTWRCRDTGDSESALAERAEFLENEGWLAANGRMGTPNELEYKIKIPKQEFRLAVVYIKSSYPYEKVPWPAHLDDDCIKPTPGGMPESLAFSPDRWQELQLSR